MPLMFEPGARWAYGGSLDHVGRMVEIAGGQPLDRYFRDHTTGPPRHERHHLLAH
jgi:hypothetical protein